MKTKRAVACLAIIAVVSLAAMLLACGSDSKSSRTTKFLAVTDLANHRVLLYNAPFSMGQSASVALGQTAFNASTPDTTATTLHFPTWSIADSAGNIYVSDSFNCRVLQFKPPFTTGMAATLALGQPGGATNLTSNTCLSGVAATATGTATK